MKVTTTTVVDDGKEDTAAKAVWDGAAVSGALVKAEEDRRYTLTVAYPADRADVAVAQDGHRDFASKQAVEEAAWNYLVKSPNVGLWHADGTDGAGQVVESYVYRGPDWPVPVGDAEYVVKAGDWMLGVQWSPESWQLIKDGKIGGVSMQGTAKRRKATVEAIDKLRS